MNIQDKIYMGTGLACLVFIIVGIFWQPALVIGALLGLVHAPLRPSSSKDDGHQS